MPRIQQLISILVGLFAITLTIIVPTLAPDLAFHHLSSIFKPAGRLATIFRTNSNMATNMTTPKRTPVYFVSHGGPTTMYETDHPVYPKFQAMGREITQIVKPKAIVVFSAHWQAMQSNTIEVNTSEDEPLLYDFYGFPRHYYAEKFPSKGNAQLAGHVIELLGQSGIRAVGTDRGLDHGVFVPFKVMFDPEKNPIKVPIVQVSLFEDETDATAHIKLGKAVQKLREEGVLIIVSGMAVHNTRHFRMGLGKDKTMEYAVTFDEALREAVEKQPGQERDRAMAGLLNRADARQAHPTFEHLLPIHIGVGAAGEDVGKQLWTMPEGSLSWAQYRFGSVEA